MKLNKKKGSKEYERNKEIKKYYVEKDGKLIMIN